MHCGGFVRMTGQHEAARIGGVQAGEHVEERGLACAVGADQAVDLAAVDGDADVRECLQAAESLGHASDLEHHIV
ncbi:hypothetical protein SDC9_212824 [bioreactor metagenome]|uniref:Uncharacterized protein n=1 Tax=bioreactor metagenome TaxID=1076179 RepID=A0A645JN09_9ZZZZ